MKRVRGNKGSSEGGERFVGVDLDEAEEEFDTDGEEVLRGDKVGEELRDRCFDGRDGVSCTQLGGTQL